MTSIESLKFTVKENGNLFSASEMTEPESYSIEVEVNDLLPKPEGECWFEVDRTVWDNECDEDPEYMVLRCYKLNPTPKNSSQMESKLPAPLPANLLDAIAGKTFRVHPKQYGLSPWADNVEIVFEPVNKTKGLPASYLIAEALKTHPVN
jgi:hypothetical protein